MGDSGDAENVLYRFDFSSLFARSGVMADETLIERMRWGILAMNELHIPSVRGTQPGEFGDIGERTETTGERSGRDS